MNKVIAIIGSGYGDEGKGLMTDYHSSQYENPVVIRSNGGSQAGHTVVTPEGQRHVFSHFGSGTFNDTPTFLSKHFVANPILFAKEHKAFIKEFKFTPIIYMSAACPITTPFDMLLNQTHEEMRGKDIHGSCGVGFGETIERGLVYDKLLVTDIKYSLNTDGTYISNFLHDIRDNYVPTRIDFRNVSAEFLEVLNSDKLINDFIAACEYMLENVAIQKMHDFKNETLIFEAAQGLLLDMDYGYFPHVTRSNCGMKNISNLLKDLQIESKDITVNYVTRSYTTRHGAGQLLGENSFLKHRYDIVDKTNIPNKFQGTLRFAPINMKLFTSVTNKDFLNYAPRGAKKIHTVTCMDQLNDHIDVVSNNNITKHISIEEWMNIVNDTFDYASYGQTRNDVKLLKTRI